MKIFKNVKKEYIISIAISLMIILLVFVNIYTANYRKEESKYMAEKGRIDLGQWDIDKEKIVRLDGQWEFYPGKLLDPNSDFKDEEKTYINVPENWMEYLNEEALENGSGTYRLTVKVPKDMVYAIKSRTIRFANRIFFNGEQISQVGTPSTDESDFKTVSKYNLGAEKSINKEIELIVHVTSFNYRSGGILKSLEIGDFDTMVKSSDKSLVLDALVVTVCITLSLYFLIIYFQRNKNKYLLYFSILNLLTGFYLSTMNEQLLSLIYDYKPLGRTEIQGSLIILTGIFFLRFVHEFFKEISNKYITNLITIYMSLILLFSIILELVKISYSFVFMQALVLLGMSMAYIYIFTILVKAMNKKRDLIEYILVVVVSASSYWIILFIKTFFEISLGNVPVFLIVTTMFSMAALMTHQLQLDHKRATRLSERLLKDDKLKDEFLIKSSHEFKRPLQNIKNLTSYLLEGKKGLLSIDQQENLIHIKQETDILRRITDDLLDASSMENEEVKLRLTPINSYEIVEEIIKEIENLIPYNKAIILKNNIKKDFPLIVGDHDKFRQIVYDLIDNAIKYTETGYITISARSVDNKAELRVKDTGIGIEEKDLKEVFNIFFQKSIGGKTKEGLGLGLTIVKDLVEVQGGKIHVESTVGQGSSFIFTLPLYKGTIIEEKKSYKYNSDFLLETPQGNQDRLKDTGEKDIDLEKILIIDEKNSSRRFLKNIVEELEYHILTVSSGKEALEIIKKEKIDLIILDFMLTDISSYELCKEIRKNYSMGELPILILTSSGRTRNLIATFNYGANDFQKKPVDPEELKSRIQSLLLIKATAEEGIEKEFQYFYSQISPHFLYNTLNTIIGLSYIDSKKSRKALNNLAVYLRGKLDIHRKKGFVSLDSELDLVRAYLEIEELRFGERLEIIYDIDESLQAKTPPLTLQPIVENAVKHGISTSSSGRIEIKTQKEKDGLISITIKDNGEGMTAEEQEELLEGNGNGIGFKNVMERIKILKGASLTLKSSLEEGTKIKIRIPEVRNDEDNENSFS